MRTSLARHNSVFFRVMAGARDQSAKQNFKYFLALDFEAQCQQGRRIQPQEIVEFPCIMVDAQNFQIIDTFHQYIKPIAYPKLTDFCTELTGITQDMVEDCNTWVPTMDTFIKWYKSHDLNPVNATFVTCGNWDLASCLPGQCAFSQVDIPLVLDVGCSGQFVNLKSSYQQFTGKYGKGLTDMQKELGLEFEGRLHSGIDDCSNILTIMKTMAKGGHTFSHNGTQ